MEFENEDEDEVPPVYAGRGEAAEGMASGDSKITFQLSESGGKQLSQRLIGGAGRGFRSGGLNQLGFAPAPQVQP